jgi:endonuclease/exonuclease/phosphatase (EEP) superfamily protein YafD
MRILSANLRAGLADPDALRSLIDERGVDVACFQELGPAQAEAVRDALPHGVLEPGAGPTRYHGMGIATREPIEVELLPLEGRRGFVTRLDRERLDCMSDDESPVELMNVHVLVPLSRRSVAVTRQRWMQVRQLLAYLDETPGQPRLMVGDLNLTPRYPAYRSLTLRLRDLHLEHARSLGRRPPSTWGLWPAGPRMLRLDHALGAGIAARSVEVVPRRGSDHSGLLVEL